VNEKVLAALTDKNQTRDCNFGEKVVGDKEIVLLLASENTAQLSNQYIIYYDKKLFYFPDGAATGSLRHFHRTALR